MFFQLNNWKNPKWLKKDVLHPLHPLFDFFSPHISLFFPSLSVSSVSPFQRSEGGNYCICEAAIRVESSIPSLSESLYTTKPLSSQKNLSPRTFPLVSRNIAYLSLSYHNQCYAIGFSLSPCSLCIQNAPETKIFVRSKAARKFAGDLMESVRSVFQCSSSHGANGSAHFMHAVQIPLQTSTRRSGFRGKFCWFRSFLHVYLFSFSSNLIYSVYERYAQFCFGFNWSLKIVRKL